MFQYQESIAYDDIPVLPMEELARSVIERCRRSWRVVAFFGVPGREGTELVCILADASSRLLDAVRAELGKYVYCPSLSYARVELARLGNDAGIIGAAMLGRKA